MISSIVILTGAGVSAESGLATFRDSDGALWHNRRPEEVATPEAYRDNPQLVLQFYNERRRQLLEHSIQPNPAHRALARLQQQFDGSVFLVTQNVDDLHERAGTVQVCHMHGELLRMFCTRCQHHSTTRGDILVCDQCSACGHSGTLRPAIVWFGEMPQHMDQIQQQLSQCDLFVAIGTSGHVYPAAGFVDIAGSHGADTLELNLEASAVQDQFAEHIYGPAAQTVPVWVERLLQQQKR